MAERKLSSTNYYNQAFLEEKCALNELIYLLSKRWMTEVLFSIEAGNNRFTGLKEDLEHISDHILADRLKLLEQHGLIHKAYLPGTPPRTEYELSEKGNELSSLLEGLCDFAETQMQFQSDNSIINQ
ncbi:winged helix-turn-helix transcriptional regulator [Mucilaginibacter sp. X4EP1]|uniref:winged helix-turn-helix transcriptional regulator n=1 Tax=Mucilaginibacter sp. X4EP1 TaxID=2723092 RepID=UPI002167118E|nr:helix-turn-helix domain-containing protein [Mucilaginibacter sp. X4EP1]MCS3812394.1 DNA-binding HxlR family transcriptional regulator [Mucilaginibacter sp. X4EP1]